MTLKRKKLRCMKYQSMKAKLNNLLLFALFGILLSACSKKKVLIPDEDLPPQEETGSPTSLVSSVVLDDCDGSTGWSSANTLSVNITDKKEGTGALQSVGANTTEFSKVFSPKKVAVAGGALQFWYYVSDVTKFSPGDQVELGSGGGPDVNEYNWSLSGLVNGWNLVTLNFSSAGTTGGAPDLNAINWFRIYHVKNGSVTTRLDAIELMAPSASLFSDNFDDGNFNGWNPFGTWSVESGKLLGAGNSTIFTGNYSNFVYEGDITLSANEQRAGLIFRATKGAPNSFSGYFAFLRVSSDRVRLELGKESNGRTHLADEMVLGVAINTTQHMKVVCNGPNIWVYINDMNTPAIKEYDPSYTSGAIGLKTEDVSAHFDNIKVSSITSLPQAPLVQNWSAIRGAVFVTSNAVNATQMMEEYTPEIIDRELSYAKVYGFNTIQIYLHWLLWNKDKTVFLNNIEDFLVRANKYGLKVIPIFFDDAGGHNPPRLAPYDPPRPGIHNSQMNLCPGSEIKDVKYDEYKARLQGYVQDVVNAHKTDSRILFWTTFNEPIRAAGTQRLVADAYSWIKATGTTLPVTATSGGFLGGKYSDFYTFHMYDNHSGANGGSEHLNTECLNRRPAGSVPAGQSFIPMMDYFQSKNTGFIIWDLTIGRDNCRFPWGSPLNAPEPTVPFHGFLYPDGHPWSVEEAKRLRSDLSAQPLFNVEYFTGNFTTSKKVSITPRIDFDLGNETGTGSPDASVGIPVDNFSIRWNGKFEPSTTGSYTFFTDCDNIARVWIGNTQIINKSTNVRQEVSGAINLTAGQAYTIKVEYVHGTGNSSFHLQWSGPGLAKQVMLTNLSAPFPIP